jgi:hypothetical protein
MSGLVIAEAIAADRAPLTNGNPRHAAQMHNPRLEKSYTVQACLSMDR